MSRLREKTTVIHVNRHMLAATAKDGVPRPSYTIKEGRRTTYAHGVTIDGGVVELIDPRLVPPLKCGARAYLGIRGGAIHPVDPCRFADIAATSI